ncbi:antirestriction protein ArdC [Pedobacter sp. CG_S7]|uniref:ArdC family protein n=1 Tax=Pedobacter sp. CG_S7 TaxID=3143930 RepID=UPI00339B4274
MKANDKFSELQEKVTNEIVALLESGTVAWHKPWTSYGMPQNAFTQRNYDGFNAFYLNLITISKNYSAPYFMTFKQASEKGGNVRKGEKGYQVVFWKIQRIVKGTTTDTTTGEETDNFYKKFTPFVWTVFNIDQIENINIELTAPERADNQILDNCQVIIEDMPNRPKLQIGGNEAFYRPSTDTVQMPQIADFESSAAYYGTVFHEFVHSTGHKSRLNRFAENESPAFFGSPEYSKEELMAELGAAFLCAHTGLINNTIQGSAAYIKGWLKALKNDKSLIFTAANKASKAANYIIGLTPDQQEPTEAEPSKEPIRAEV